MEWWDESMVGRGERIDDPYMDGWVSGWKGGIGCWLEMV